MACSGQSRQEAVRSVSSMMNGFARTGCAALLATMLAACAGVDGRPASVSIPDHTSPGAQAFSARCSSCHATPHPARHDWHGWLYLVSLMERRMAERGMAAMSADEKALILAYLKEHAR